MKDDGCPPETEKVCPKGMEEEKPKGASRMAGGPAGCQCVPDFLISLVKKDVGEEKYTRAAPDVFKNQKIKMGKITCTCSLTLMAQGTKLSPKSKATCDKKCSGVAKKVVLTGRSKNVYTLAITSKKGKAKLKGTVKLAAPVTPKPPKPTRPPATTQSPGTGSGNTGGSAGEAGGPSCSCVAVKNGGGGSGSEPGSGSGPATGSPGTGSPGTGSGSGSGTEPGSGSGQTEGPEGGNGGNEGGNGGETGTGGGGGECPPYPADHTMTIYPGPAAECGFELKFSGLDADTKKELLDKHNEQRQKVAAGNEAGQPSATNMRKLVWDEELETIAQRWTDQCKFDHDKNRDLCDGTIVGQNAYESSSSAESYDYEVNPMIGDAVMGWYDEVTSPGFDSANISPFVFGGGTGHYTALVWAETDRVGCGRVYYEDTDGWFKHLVICNYAVGGNLIGAAMYEAGAKCSNCPAGYSCDTTYDALCTK